MKWKLIWYEMYEDESFHRSTAWANSWEEALGCFIQWTCTASNVVQGEVICYWGDTPYGDGKPCLQYRILDAEIEEEE